uniref:Uncharacterized protein n=1 Tax=Oryza punctata TaxID=4537 RepID=A0A0E0KQ99_ORYPU
MCKVFYYLKKSVAVVFDSRQVRQTRAVTTIRSQIQRPGSPIAPTHSASISPHRSPFLPLPRVAASTLHRRHVHRVAEASPLPRIAIGLAAVAALPSPSAAAAPPEPPPSPHPPPPHQPTPSRLLDHVFFPFRERPGVFPASNASCELAGPVYTEAGEGAKLLGVSFFDADLAVLEAVLVKKLQWLLKGTQEYWMR